MLRWLTVALALCGTGAYGVTLDPDWTSLDSFSITGTLGSPRWTQYGGAALLASDGSRAYASNGRAYAAFDAATFPTTGSALRTRLSAFSAGINPLAQSASSLLGVQDASNYCEVKLVVNASTGGFSRLFLNERSGGADNQRVEYLNLGTYGVLSAVRVDAWLNGTTIQVEVQPLTAAGEPSGNVIPYTWSNVPAAYAANRRVGVGGFGPVKIDDYLGYTLPEPVTWVLLAGSCVLLGWPRRR